MISPTTNTVSSPSTFLGNFQQDLWLHFAPHGTNAKQTKGLNLERREDYIQSPEYRLSSSGIVNKIESTSSESLNWAFPPCAYIRARTQIWASCSISTWFNLSVWQWQCGSPTFNSRAHIALLACQKIGSFGFHRLWNELGAWRRLSKWGRRAQKWCLRTGLSPPRIWS